MSSARSTRYQVVSATELRRRDLARATARFDAARGERGRLVSAIQAQRRVYGDHVSRVAAVESPRRAGGPTALDSAAGEMEKANAVTAARLQSEVKKARTAVLG
jgi:hypothetical protein